MIFSLISFSLLAEDIETVAAVQGLCFPFTFFTFVYVDCFLFLGLLRAWHYPRCWYKPTYQGVSQRTLIQPAVSRRMKDVFFFSFFE